MEDLALLFECAMEIRAALQTGRSANQGASRFLSRRRGPFSQKLQKVLYLIDHHKEYSEIAQFAESPLQRGLFFLLVRSQRGETILAELQILILEMRSASESQLEEFAQSMPIVMLMPLLTLQFPAFLILLLGPILSDLSRSLG